ncbi:hypothetical protein [Kitasatospora sp. CB02891]|uniref:hypothetical protein n=1 Tax=Kitasatospora sp. CB02891 TaxID=2020329 RepID=UPI0012FDFC8D|nr:hypothetical protein [Kitasatospora sp. CB02891]
MTTPEPTNPYAGPPQAPAAPNPYAAPPQTPPPPGGVPLPPPAPAEQAWGGTAAPPVAPTVPVVKNVPLAVLAGVGAALAAALLYGFIVKAMEREFSVLAIGIGAAVGFAVGKVGGAHRALPPVAALITLLHRALRPAVRRLEGRLRPPVGAVPGTRCVLRRQRRQEVRRFLTDHQEGPPPSTAGALSADRDQWPELTVTSTRWNSFSSV